MWGVDEMRDRVGREDMKKKKSSEGNTENMCACLTSVWKVDRNVVVIG